MLYEVITGVGPPTRVDHDDVAGRGQFTGYLGVADQRVRAPGGGVFRRLANLV